MCKALTAVVAFSLGTLAAVTVHAAAIVANFDTSAYGATEPEGLAFDGAFLYIVNDVSGDQRVYRVNRNTGVGTFAFVAPGDDSEGIAFDGTNLRIAGGNGLIYTVDRLTGAVLGSIPAPASQMDGLAFGAGKLYASDTQTQQVYVLDPATGAVNAQFATDGFDGLEFALGAPNVLFLGDVGSDQIVKARASDLSVLEIINLTELAQAAGIEGTDNPYGLAFDGQFLYYTDVSRDQLVKVALGSANSVSEPNGLALAMLGFVGLLIQRATRARRRSST